MHWLVDAIYLLGAVITSPVWLFRLIRTGKIRTDWRARFGRTALRGPGSAHRPCILLHAVSVGEVNATRLLVELLANHPSKPRIVIASTTDTGFARAQELFGVRSEVVRYPFDLSFAVTPFLSAIAPDLVVLVELEIWPNFTALCQKRAIPICVVNGRLTARSAKRYRLLGPFIRPSFRRLDAIAAQSEQYASRFRDLGVSPTRVHVTGTMKWDTAQLAPPDETASSLADALGIHRDLPLVVAGSTAPGEHELIRDAIPNGVQLLCAPRKPEWFDQAADALPGCARRSRGDRWSPTGRFLLDTIGELRAAYALADVVVVGRTFAPLHGSDMMEPIALGKATVVGPNVDDFQLTVEALQQGDGLVRTDAGNLGIVLNELLGDEARRAELARNGRAVIESHQGATQRNVDIIIRLLDRDSPGMTDAGP